MKKLFVFLLFMFCANFAYAVPIASNVINGCNTNNFDVTNNNANLYAVFVRNQYTCTSGNYLPANAVTCASCPYGHTCRGGTFYFSETTDRGITVGQYTCASGYYLPANAVSCVACTSGFTCAGGTFSFNATKDQGILFDTPTTTNITSGCNKTLLPANTNNIYARFTPNSYTCSSGQYLPANVDACTACPNGYTCAGGTYTFNETTDQGIVANTITINWDNGNGGTHLSNTCTYGGDITTPTTAPVKRGYRFLGWVFD